ncbi:unnamed protein product [Adineta steineri]|uniref:MAM domain-containing protein n=1 Tax=Adineta steineri TaxID=433720 RepID=A0A814WTY5_9BILA|nr:unnamed protein product [Adineta steineri]CAF1485453.1 unnamed protein product [Adineta steineri]
MSSVLIVLLHTFILCRSQIINYQCRFDTSPLTGDCQFTPTTGGPVMSSDTGINAGPVAPKQPFSDVKAISSPTMPDNEHCVLPYPYPGFGAGWDMHFCRRFINDTFTCPTQSGAGRCDTGRYGMIRLPASAGVKDLTYVANVDGSTNSEQCLDFYYYITDTTGNAKMQIGWKNDEDEETGLIIEVAAVPSENKWQHKKVSFMGPLPLSSYKLTVRAMRDAGVLDFNFALDEMYIYDGLCGNVIVVDDELFYFIFVYFHRHTDGIPIITTTTSESTPVIDTTATEVLEPATTSGSTTTESITSESTTPGNTIPGSTTTGSTLAGSTLAGSTTTGSTTTGSTTTPNMPTDTGPNLALILPLAVGIPVSLGIIGSIAYYFKVFKPKHKISVGATNTNNDIPMVSPNNTTDNNTTVDALVV